MDSTSLAAEVSAFEANLNDFYDAFQKGKKIFLDEATSQPLRAENEKLRRELKASDDENEYLKRDLAEAETRIKELQRDLEVKSNLLSAIGAYARGGDAVPDRKRERSPETELHGKRSRDESSLRRGTRYSSYHTAETGRYERSDSGFITNSPHSRDSHGVAESSTLTANTPHNEEIRPAYSPTHATKHSSRPSNSYQSSGLSIMGAAHPRRSLFSILCSLSH